MTDKDSIKEIRHIYIYQNQLESATPGRDEKSHPATDNPATAFRQFQNETLADPNFQDDTLIPEVPSWNLYLLTTLIT